MGILGGTFDPIHEGHLMAAESARECLRLDKVIFIPAGRPWLKSGSSVTEPAHRLAMVELAIEGKPHFEVSDIEVARPGPTYTVDTLAELRRKIGDRAELYLILGMDSVRELYRWRQPELIFEMCIVAAVSRPGVADVTAEELARDFPSSRGRFLRIRGSMVEASATEIRASAGEGGSPPPNVPDSVRAYILERGLYSASE